MLTHFCLKFFEDWHQTDLKKFDLKKKWFQNTKEKKFLFSFLYLFIHLFIYSPFFAGGGEVGGVGWKEAKGFDSAAVESSYICWIQVLDTMSQNLKKNINQ